MVDMTRIAVTRRMPVPVGRVWAALADLASHTVWMKDAESIDFVTAQRAGVGTRMKVKTLVGPFRTIDEMEVVRWDEGRAIGVVHTGLVEGQGTFTIAEASPGDTDVRWDEELSFPWWLGGPFTAMFARPVLAAIWRGNLRRLEESLSSP